MTRGPDDPGCWQYHYWHNNRSRFFAQNVPQLIITLQECYGILHTNHILGSYSLNAPYYSKLSHNTLLFYKFTEVARH